MTKNDDQKDIFVTMKETGLAWPPDATHLLQHGGRIAGASALLPGTREEKAQGGRHSFATKASFQSVTSDMHAKQDGTKNQ